MPRKAPLGEFEQLVLLAILRLNDQAFGLGIRRELEKRAHRTVSRGAFYATLYRLEKKKLIRWTAEPPNENRGGIPQRRYEVSAAGIRALSFSRNTLLSMWQGVESTLEGAE
jgi:DNA-binding PadR family transcriptional regulator